jgi:putative transposase
VPSLAFDAEIRKVICSTNAIESVHARIRRAVKARGHFPNEQAALECVWTAIHRSLDNSEIRRDLASRLREMDDRTGAALVDLPQSVS